MDQSEELSIIPGGVSDYPPEDMDITADSSESESHSNLPTTNQGAGFSHGDLHDFPWGGGRRRIRGD